MNLLSHRYWCRYCTILLFFILSRFSVTAQTVWTNGGADGNWANPANWMGGVLPMMGQSITLSAGTYSISSNIPPIVFGEIRKQSTGNVTFNQTGGVLRTTQWNHVDFGGVIIAANMTLQLEVGVTHVFNYSTFPTRVFGKLIYQDGTSSNGVNGGFEIQNGGELEVRGNAQINVNPGAFLSGAKLTYTGTTPKVISMTDLPMTLVGVVTTISNTGGVTLNNPRTLQGGVCTIKNNLTLSAALNVTSGGKIQIDGTPTLGGGANINYASQNDTLEYIGAGNFTIDGQEISGSGPMFGTILVNKPGSAVNGIAGTLTVNGSFLLKQGTWNNNAGGRLLLNGGAGTYYTTTSGTTLNVNTGAVLQINPSVTFTNNGTVNIAGGGSCIISCAVGNIATIQGTSTINYLATTATLRYIGSGSKMTTSQELPQTMPGGIMIYNSSVVNLGFSVSVMGAVTVGSVNAVPSPLSGILSTGPYTLQLNHHSTIERGGLSISNNGVLFVADGVSVTKPFGTPQPQMQVLMGGTLRLDGSGYVIGDTLINYSNGSNLLFTGANNHTITAIEMSYGNGPAAILNANIHINKPAGAQVFMPGNSAANRVDLAAPAYLSITSGILQAGQGVRSILRILSTTPNSVTFANTGAGYVEGPLQRTLATGAATYLYPLGKSGVYLPMLVKNANVAGGTILAAEAYSVGSGGTPLDPLTQLSSSEYWRCGVALGTINQMQIGVFRAGGFAATTGLGMMENMNPSMPTGNYTFVGGTPLTNGLLSDIIATMQPSGTQRYITPGTMSLPPKAGFGWQVQYGGAALSLNQESVAAAHPSYDSLTTFTVEALVRPAWSIGGAGYDPCFFSIGDGGNTAGMKFSVHLGNILAGFRFTNGSSQKTTAVGAFRRFTQYHLAVTYSGGTITYYIDGRIAGQDNLALGSGTGGRLHIGSNGGTNDFWRGAIDEVRLWNTALPQTVIAEWRGRELQGSHPQAANLRGYWRFNEGFPLQSADLSGLNNPVSLTGVGQPTPPQWVDNSLKVNGITDVTGTGTAILPATKVGGNPITFSLTGANGGSTMATVGLDAIGNLTYTPNRPVNTDDADFFTYSVSDGMNSSSATVEIRFRPVIAAETQFVRYNKVTQITTASLRGGTNPLTLGWTPLTNIAPTNTTNPSVLLLTNATYTFQGQDAFGYTGSQVVSCQIQPLLLAFSNTSSTGTFGLPSIINAGAPFAMRWGIFSQRTGLLDANEATLNLAIAPVAGGTAQLSCAYTTSFMNQSNAVVPGLVVNWSNPPLAGGTTQAVITLLRTAGAPINATSITVTISTGAGAPIIAGFAPMAGGVGTQVTITGAAFLPGATVNIGGVAAQNIIVDSPTQIRATVAPGASTGLVRVGTGGGIATAAQMFTIVPPPQITNFTPVSGFPGSIITVTGQNFISPVTVSFGGVTSPSVTVLSPTQLLAEVGNGASGIVTVQNAGGTAASVTTFSFFGAPTITSISPAQGGANTVVTVRGTDFQPIDSVFIGSTHLDSASGSANASATLISPTELRITLKSIPLSGRIRVVMPSGAAISPTAFTFIPAPKIDSIVPSVGGANTAVRLVGRNFVNVDTLRFGNVNITGFMVSSTTAVTFTMPPQMQNSTSAIVISALGGRDTSKTIFQYVLPPQITSFTPSAGAGAWVSVTGANLVGVTSVSFGGIKADSLQAVSPQLVRAKIAQGGASGKVDVIAAGGTARSTQDFRFLFPPTITAFSPTSGATGASVEITGTDFVNVTSVSIGGVSVASFSVASDTRIVATLSAKATSGTVRVTTQQGQATSASPFTVIVSLGPPPTIFSFTPPTGEAGAEVFITGQNIANAGLVQFGGVTAASFRVVSPTIIAAIVPAGATSGSVRITTPNGVATSVAVFRFVSASIGGEGLTPIQRDSSVLARVYALTGGGAWFNERNWMTEMPVSSWAGVTVENGQVTRLVLANNGLLGSLPSLLAELPALKALDLSGNQLTGVLPSSIATLKTLEILRLRNNQFTGAVPVLSTLASLQVLDLGNNRFVGDLPRGLCTLPNLREVRLDSNGFSGAIPNCIGDLKRVEILNLSENLLSDTIPATIGSMTALRELILFGNQLSGAIPQTLGTQATILVADIAAVATKGAEYKRGTPSLQSVANLRILDLSRNRLSGSIPASVGQCLALTTVNLANNRLTGNLPLSFGNLSALQSLDVSCNQLSETLPTYWGNLRQLQTLSLRANNFSGAVPLEIGRLSALTTMWLDSNSFTGLTDSVANLTALKRFSMANNRLKALPQLRRTSGTTMDSMNVAFNALTFESLERNLAGIRSAVYSPQDSVLSRIDTLVRVFGALRVSGTIGGFANDYQWYKGSRLLAGATDSVLKLDRVARADTGEYTCYVRNRTASQLTLIRRMVSLRALPPQTPSERPALIAPQLAAQSVTITPTLVWSTTAFTSNYEVEISTKSDFSDMVIKLTVSDPFRTRLSLAAAQALENLTTYFWRVRAVSEGLQGAWSDVGRFTTIPAGRTVNVETINFGRVILRKSVERSLTVQNLSSAAVIVQSIRLVEQGTQGQFQSGGLTSAVRLEPDSSVVVKVRFTPTNVGEQTASVVVGYTVASSGSNVPTEVSFGTVLTGVGGALMFAGSEVDFGLLTAGLTKTENIQLTNVATTALSIGTKVESGSENGSKARFGLSDPLIKPIALQPNESAFVNVNCILTADTATAKVSGFIRFVAQVSTASGTVTDTLLIPTLVSVRSPQTSDVTIAPRLIADKQQIPPGGIVTLGLKITQLDYLATSTCGTTPKEQAQCALGTLNRAADPVFTADIVFNSQVLLPEAGESSLRRVASSGDFVTYTIAPTRWVPDDAGALDSVLTRIRCRVIAGSTDATTLRVTRFLWDTTSVGKNLADKSQVIINLESLVTSSTASFTAAVSRAGGKRLVAPIDTAKPMLVLSPNPADNSVELAFTVQTAGALFFEVLTLQGMAVMSTNGEHYEAGAHSLRLETSRLASGSYLVRMKTSGGEVITERLQVVR